MFICSITNCEIWLYQCSNEVILYYVFCLDANYEKQDGVHGVLVHDKKDEQKWTSVCGRRRKKASLIQALQKKKPKAGLKTNLLSNSVSSGETMESLCVQKDTATNKFFTTLPINTKETGP